MAYGNITTIDGLVKAKYYWVISTAEAVEKLDLPWCLFLNYPLVDSSHYAQVRNIEDHAILQDIREYAEMMRLGDQFPPVIVTADGYLIDGHTRTEAARRNDYDTFPALVLTTVNLGDLSAESPFRDKVMSLGLSRNRKNGRRMSDKDTARILHSLSPRHTVAEIIRDNSVSKSFATAVWNAARAERYAKSLDIKWDNTFSLSLLKLFGGKIDKYTQPTWKAVFSLAQDAHMKQVAVNTLMKAVEELPDEASKLAYVDEERTRLNPVIASRGYTPVTYSRRTKQALGVIRKKTPEMMVEKDNNPKVRREHLEWLMEVDELIRKTIVQQEDYENRVLGR